MRRRYPAGNAGDGVVSFPDQLKTERSGSETSDGAAVFVEKLEKVHKFAGTTDITANNGKCWQFKYHLKLVFLQKYPSGIYKYGS